MAEWAKRAQLGEPLTDLQNAIMAAMARGDSLQRISSVLFVSHGTVTEHLSAIHKKYGVPTTIAAMHMWTMEQPRLIRLHRKAHGEAEGCEE